MQELMKQVERLVEEYISEMNIADVARTGLDPRALRGRVYWNSECIAIHNRQRAALNYYGGFEYVDEECVMCVGSYTFYSREECRVDEVIFQLEHNSE